MFETSKSVIFDSVTTLSIFVPEGSVNCPKLLFYIDNVCSDLILSSSRTQSTVSLLFDRSIEFNDWADIFGNLVISQYERSS